MFVYDAAMVLQSQFCLTISVRVFHAVSYAHVLYGIVIPSSFNRELNIMIALPVHQPPTLRRKSLLAKVGFDAKKVVGECC